VKKLAFFLKNNVMLQIGQKLAIFYTIFSSIFSKIMTSVPRPNENSLSFLQTRQQVSKYFSEIFPQLVPNGRGRLHFEVSVATGQCRDCRMGTGCHAHFHCPKPSLSLLKLTGFCLIEKKI
jgi:hypothetical protein